MGTCMMLIGKQMPTAHALYINKFYMGLQVPTFSPVSHGTASRELSSAPGGFSCADSQCIGIAVLVHCVGMIVLLFSFALSVCM